MSGASASSSCIVDVSEAFVFQSPSFQNACNMVYEYKKNRDIANNATVTGKTYKFKTDFERMQYLLGLYGQTSIGRA
jgi:hypothetical protein